MSFAQHGRSAEHRQHVHRMGRPGGLVSGRRHHADMAGKARARFDRQRRGPEFRGEMLDDWRKSRRPHPTRDCHLRRPHHPRLERSNAACFAGRTRYRRCNPSPRSQRSKIAIQRAYLVSCVNSRLARFGGCRQLSERKKIAPGVKFYLAAASREVQEQAEHSGAWQTLLDAGAVALPPGCGPCIGLGTGLLEAGEVGISATNRNFKGRMGSREARCYLGSPAVVAASAAAGYICGPSQLPGGELRPQFEKFASSAPAAERVEILPGFPAAIRGRLVFLPQDNLNTDGIYGKDFTYREDMTPAMMAAVVMQNYDPQFAARMQPGDLRDRRLQLRHRFQPRAGGDRIAGQRHSPDYRR